MIRAGYTLATTHVLRSADGKYGADVTVFRSQNDLVPCDVPCEFSTLDALHVAITARISEALRLKPPTKEPSPHPLCEVP